ncbi:LysR family transcriptional regulator [Spongiactinospora gelatinilytica]|uniref:LysR family transcriptional regulator n=1 Tax=Spongiactinospora gelatinilytica TaxID=2666298 RepID=A0A2W2GT19_9ACTN|nr:LysR family transcriptional regulator [Spongiactinospora gelatinilytica]PZG51551.1 LysR family transcriptional regulator [Spongiactinospora gelatinilytica]
MELALLRSFLAVYRTGSFTKAAGLLAISQPTVTCQIRNLEKEIGQLLFLRTSRGAIPTEAAEELAEETGAHIDALEAAVLRRQDPLDLTERTLSLAGPADLVSTLLLPALAGLIHDGLRLRVGFGPTDDLLDDLSAGLHDLVVATAQPRRHGIVETPLMDEEFLLVGPAALAGRVPPEQVASAGPAALKGIPIIAYADNLPIVRRYWQTVFAERPSCGAQVVVPDLRAVLATVKAGGGISVVPSYLCAGELAREEIRPLHEPAARPLNTLYLATRTGASANVVLSAVHSHLLAEAKSWSAMSAGVHSDSQR